MDSEDQKRRVGRTNRLMSRLKEVFGESNVAEQDFCDFVVSSTLASRRRGVRVYASEEVLEDADDDFENATEPAIAEVTKVLGNPPHPEHIRQGTVTIDHDGVRFLDRSDSKQ